jgi:hypothetical protein
MRGFLAFRDCRRRRHHARAATDAGLGQATCRWSHAAGPGLHQSRRRRGPFDDRAPAPSRTNPPLVPRGSGIRLSGRWLLISGAVASRKTAGSSRSDAVPDPPVARIRGARSRFRIAGRMRRCHARVDADAASPTELSGERARGCPSCSIAIASSGLGRTSAFADSFAGFREALVASAIACSKLGASRAWKPPRSPTCSYTRAWSVSATTRAKPS